MQIFTVSFFGHRQVSNGLDVEKRLEPIIRTLLVQKEYVVFLVGRDGEFDQIVSSTVHRCKRILRSDNNALVLVLPYLTATFRAQETAFRTYYDEIEVCADAAHGYFKAAHQTRNHGMVDRSDLVIFCVDHKSGGTWQTMRYAEKQGIPCINIHMEKTE